MSFTPVIPMTGYAGWAFLSRTLERQQESFVESGTVKRAAEYFRENIGKATTAEALVGDRRLLEVALGAFGLEDDINAYGTTLTPETLAAIDAIRAEMRDPAC